jgi:integrase
MLAVAGTARDKLLVTVLALTGLRIGQVLGLHRSDMHLMANPRTVTPAARYRRGAQSRTTAKPHANP